MSNFMELLQWDLPLSLIEMLSKLPNNNLSQSQLRNLPLNNMFMAAYMVAYVVGDKANVVKTALAFCLSAIATYTLISTIDWWAMYCLLSIIYALTCVKINKIKILIPCFMMTLFMVFMAIDEARYGTANTWIYAETTQTWSWVHYELVVSAIHGLIIASCIHWSIKSLVDSLGRIVNNLRSFVRALCSAACL